MPASKKYCASHHLAHFTYKSEDFWTQRIQLTCILIHLYPLYLHFGFITWEKSHIFIILGHEYFTMCMYMYKTSVKTNQKGLYNLGCIGLYSL